MCVSVHVCQEDQVWEQSTGGISLRKGLICLGKGIWIGVSTSNSVQHGHIGMSRLSRYDWSRLTNARLQPGPHYNSSKWNLQLT